MKLPAMIALLVLLTLLGVAACTGGKALGPYASAGYANIGGDPENGKKLIQSYGCGSCHTIPGVHSARGVVGPPLYFFSQRTMIAGELPNTPENLVRWIQNPREVEPKTAMPDLGLTRAQAYDIAAYLYTLD